MSASCVGAQSELRNWCRAVFAACRLNLWDRNAAQAPVNFTDCERRVVSGGSGAHGNGRARCKFQALCTERLSEGAKKRHSRGPIAGVQFEGLVVGSGSADLLHVGAPARNASAARAMVKAQRAAYARALQPGQPMAGARTRAKTKTTTDGPRAPTRRSSGAARAPVGGVSSWWMRKD